MIKISNLEKKEENKDKPDSLFRSIDSPLKMKGVNRRITQAKALNSKDLMSIEGEKYQI